MREMAKVNAILDQIPESAAIYDAAGKLERMNVAAQREPAVLFAPDPDGRSRKEQHRYVDGSPLSFDELPSMRALQGETVKSDYLVHDARSGDEAVAPRDQLQTELALAEPRFAGLGANRCEVFGEVVGLDLLVGAQDLLLVARVLGLERLQTLDLAQPLRAGATRRLSAARASWARANS